MTERAVAKHRSGGFIYRQGRAPITQGGPGSDQAL